MKHSLVINAFYLLLASALFCLVRPFSDTLWSVEKQSLGRTPYVCGIWKRSETLLNLLGIMKCLSPLTFTKDSFGTSH